MRALLLVVLILLICACSPQIRTEYVYQEVKVPVEVQRAAPPWLAQPYSPEALPQFLPPGQGEVSLDQEGITHLKTLIRTLTARDQAWRVWSSPDGHPEK